jgi:hypothetical protein
MGHAACVVVMEVVAVDKCFHHGRCSLCLELAIACKEISWKTMSRYVSILAILHSHQDSGLKDSLQVFDMKKTAEA